VVAWNMAEKNEFVSLLRASRGDAIVLLSTFLLTIFADLTIAIGVGVTAGAFLFLHRMAETIQVEGGGQIIADDMPDATGGARKAYTPQTFDDDAMVYRINGAFFFGATATVSAVLDRIGTRPKVFVLDFADVPLVDTTAAKALEAFVHKLNYAGTQVYFAGARPSVRRTLLMAGLRRPLVRYATTADDAVVQSRSLPPPNGSQVSDAS